MLAAIKHADLPLLWQTGRPVAALLVFLLALTARAAPLTLEDAMAAALTAHPQVAGKRAAQAAAVAEQKGADWQRYPSLSVEANAPSSGKSASVVRLDQPLWSGGRITAQRSAAERRAGAAGASVDETRLDLALRVLAALSEAVRQQERLEQAQAGVAQHEKLLAMIERRVAREVSPQADLNLAQSRLYAALNDRSATEQALSDAHIVLSELTGLTVTAVAAEPVRKAADAAGLAPDVAQAVEEALAFSPVLRRLELEREAAVADIDSKRAAYYPQLSLRLESGQGALADDRALLVLAAQPGAGLSAVSGVEAAQARKEAARLAIETARRDVRQQVTRDWNEWRAAATRVEQTQLARNTAREVAESYARQYTAGRKTWLDVMNAVREATLAEFQLADSRAQVRAALLRLKALTGKLDILKNQ